MQFTDDGRRKILRSGLATGVIAAAARGARAQQPKPPRLSVFVLDTYRGRPASGLKVDFSKEEGDTYRRIKTVSINSTGNVDEPIFTAAQMEIGDYEFTLHVAEYFRNLGVKLPERPFLNKVPVRFSIFDTNQVFHVPVLLTPWSYITYRGS